MNWDTFAAVFFAASLSLSAAAQGAAGGESGYDKSIAAIEPTDEPIRVGLAGDDPADIARYLLAQNGGASEGRISPDGKSIAFLWSISGTSQLWSVSLDGGTPRRLTFGNGVMFFRWTPDGAHLLYGADNDGNELPAYYLISADGATETMALAATEGGFRKFGDFVLDGTRIVYSSTERNGLDYDIYVNDLKAGKARMVFKGTYAFWAQSVSPDGSHLVMTESRGEDSDNLYLLNLVTDQVTTISKPGRRANHSRAGIVWAADNSGFYLASNVEREFSALMFYRLDGGFELVEEASSSIHNVSLCGLEDRYLLWTLNEGGYSRLFARDRKSNALLKTPAFSEGVYRLHCTRNSAQVVVSINGWRTPGNVSTWDLEEGSIDEVFVAGLAGLNPDRLVRPESLTFAARDGVEVQGLLYLPDESSRVDGSLPPVVFIVHGGPTMQSRPSFDAIVQHQVDQGVAVFEPNVRGSTGFGHTYVTLDDQGKRLDSVRDLVDMLAFLESDGRVDTSRAAVVGGSYGGYAVNAVLANFPGHFVAGVSLYGVADWVTALEVASPSLKAQDRIEYGDIKEQRWKDYYGKNSPIRQAALIDVPMLFSHGVMDPRIDIAETELMVKTLRGKGIEATFIRIPDEGHGWRKLKNQLFYYRRQAQFLEEKLGVTEK
jgi:dipeptidyl aminopeptidase/acylaminoacyl peptidase